MKLFFILALPPPVLPQFCPLFASLVNLLQSDVYVYILRTVLQWVVEPNGHAWTESMLQRVSFANFVLKLHMFSVEYHLNLAKI